MHPALQPLHLVEMIGELETDPAPLDRAVLVHPIGVVDAPAKQVLAVAFRGEQPAAPHLHGLDLLGGSGGVLLPLEEDLELLRHHRRGGEGLLHAARLEESDEVSRPVQALAAHVLVFQAGLLAERRAEDDGRVLAGELHRVADQLVVVLVTGPDGAGVGGLLGRAGLHLEQLRLEIAPVHVLEVRRAVREEGRELRPELAVHGAEDVHLQRVEEHGALPAHVALGELLRGELPRDGHGRPDREPVRCHELREGQVVLWAELRVRVRVLHHLAAGEGVIRAQIARLRNQVDRPRVRQHRAAQRLAVVDVHAPAHPDGAALVGEQIPETGPRQLRAVAEMEDLMIGVVQPGVDGDPLDPRIEVRSALGRFRHVHVRLGPELLECGQALLADEALHQGGRELVQLQQDDPRLAHFSPLSRCPDAPRPRSPGREKARHARLLWRVLAAPGPRPGNRFRRAGWRTGACPALAEER